MRCSLYTDLRRGFLDFPRELDSDMTSFVRDMHSIADVMSHRLCGATRMRVNPYAAKSSWQ